ncbi:MAG TPA: hypothetical protein V6C58_10210 [Allocoleopsis sp.]
MSIVSILFLLPFLYSFYFSKKETKTNVILTDSDIESIMGNCSDTDTYTDTEESGGILEPPPSPRISESGFPEPKFRSTLSEMLKNYEECE